MATVMVIGFNKVVSVVRSNAFPVDVKSVGKAGISAAERASKVSCDGASTVLASRLTVTSPSGETRRAGASGVIETDVVSGVGASLVVIAPEANIPTIVAAAAARTTPTPSTYAARRDVCGSAKRACPPD